MKEKRARETMLLVVLAVAFACYGFYAFLLAPKMAQAAELKNQVSSEDAEIRGMYNSILQYTEDAGELEEIYAQVNDLSARFYVDAQNEDYLNDLDVALRNTGVIYSSIDALEHARMDLLAIQYRCDSPYLAYADKSEEELVSLKENGEELEALLEGVQESAASPETDQLSLSVKMTGSYQSVEELVTSLNEAGQNVICGAMSITVEDGEPGISKTSSPGVAAELELQFLRLSALSGNNADEAFPEMPQTFVMPVDFVSGSYRELFPFSLPSNLF